MKVFHWLEADRPVKTPNAIGPAIKTMRRNGSRLSRYFCRANSSGVAGKLIGRDRCATVAAPQRLSAVNIANAKNNIALIVSCWVYTSVRPTDPYHCQSV